MLCRALSSRVLLGCVVLCCFVLYCIVFYCLDIFLILGIPHKSQYCFEMLQERELHTCIFNDMKYVYVLIL